MSAVCQAAAYPLRATSIASARQTSSPRRPCRSASAAQPATAPGTVTERGPISSTGSSGNASAGAGPGRVEPFCDAVAPDDREAVAADPGRHRLGHAEHRRGRERGVGRVPAALEHAQPGAGGERLARRDHPVERDRRLATVCVPEGHCADRRGRGHAAHAQAGFALGPGSLETSLRPARGRSSTLPL